jgi:hypothetical protein
MFGKGGVEMLHSLPAGALSDHQANGQRLLSELFSQV